MEAKGSLPPVTILSQMDPVHTFLPYVPKIIYNINFPSIPKYSAWSLPFRFSDHNFVRICHFPCVLHAPPICYWFDRPKTIGKFYYRIAVSHCIWTNLSSAKPFAKFWSSRFHAKPKAFNRTTLGEKLCKHHIPYA